MPNYSYVRIYADSEGESHFEDVVGDMVPTDFAPPAPPTHTGGAHDVTQSFFWSAPAGWDGEWHPTPARQFLVILKGLFTVQVSDGEIRTINPGDVLLVEDTTGKGHYSTTPADSEDNMGFITQLADDS
jgi:hypothetical protein